MAIKVQLKREVDGLMQQVNPITSEECVILGDGKKLNEVIDFATTAEDFVDETIVIEENLVDRVESMENKIETEFEQQNSQIATGLSNIKTIEQNISNKVDTEVAKVNAQLSEKANESEVVKKGYGTLSDFNEETRQAIQGMGSTEINAVLGDGNVIPKNLNFDTIKNQNSILPTSANDYVRGTLNGGVLNPSNYARIASKELIRVKPTAYYDVEALGNIYNISFEVYDSDKTYLRWINYSSASRTIQFGENECYVRLLISKVVDAVFTPTDYCSSLNFTMKENLQKIVEEFSQKIKTNNTETLKIATYNTGKFFNGVNKGIPSNKLKDQTIKIRRSIMKEKCDVLCCQEFVYFADEDQTTSSYDELFKLLYPNKFWGGSGETIYSELATLSKLTLSTNTHQWIGDDRSLLHSVVNINNKNIHIFNCHLSWNSTENRQQQIQNCITEMKKYEYVILCGDFNTLSFDEYLPFINNGFDYVNGGYFGEYPTWSNFGDTTQRFRYIDNIVYSKNLKLLDCYTNNDDISDHSMLIGEFEII